MLNKIPVEIIRAIADEGDKSVKSRLQQVNKHLKEVVCWKSEYPAEIPHREVAPDKHGSGEQCTWKPLVREYDLMMPSWCPRTANIQVVNALLKPGARQADLWKAILHAQPVPTQPVDPTPHLLALAQATHLQKRSVSEDLRRRVQGERALDAAIQTSDVETVTEALSHRADITTRRLLAALTSLQSATAHAFAVVEVMAQHIGERGLASQLEFSAGDAQGIRRSNVLSWCFETTADGALDDVDVSTLDCLMRAGFRLSPEQFQVVATMPNEGALSIALQHGNYRQVDLDGSLLATCSRDLDNKLARIAALVESGANLRALARVIIPSTNPDQVHYQFAGDFSSVTVALLANGPALPVLQRLVELGADIHSQSPNGLNAWHGLALGNCTDGPAVADFLRAQGVSVNVEATIFSNRMNNFTSTRRMTPLGAMLNCKNDIQLLRSFLQAGAKCTGKLVDGYYVWQLKYSTGTEARNLLLDHGANPSKDIVRTVALRDPPERLASVLKSRRFDAKLLTQVAFDVVAASPADMDGRLQVLLDSGALSREATAPLPGGSDFAPLGHEFTLAGHVIAQMRWARDACVERLMQLEQLGVAIDSANLRGANPWHVLAIAIGSSLRGKEDMLAESSLQTLVHYLHVKKVNLSARTLTERDGALTPLQLFWMQAPFYDQETAKRMSAYFTPSHPTPIEEGLPPAKRPHDSEDKDTRQNKQARI